MLFSGNDNVSANIDDHMYNFGINLVGIILDYTSSSD